MHSDGEKQCSRCRLLLSLEAFPVRRASADGRQGYCRSCISAWGREHRPRKLATAPGVRDGEKWCRKCETVQSVADFASNQSAKDGLQGWCRDCAAAAYRSKRQRQGYKVRPGGIPRGFKYCRTCETIKPLTDFPTRKRSTDGAYFRCRDCARRFDREQHLAKNYSMGTIQVEAMLAEQDGRCAICLTAQAIHIDHDHATGKVRGMLCFRCNAALGQLADDPATVRRAAAYLEGRSQSGQ